MTGHFMDLSRVTPNFDHPAKYSKSIIEQLDLLVAKYDIEAVWDPFGGVGGIHDLALEETFCSELEPEWAAAAARKGWSARHDFLLRDDPLLWQRLDEEWRELSIIKPRRLAIITSVTYGNRMADKHTPGPCRECDGLGWTIAEGSQTQSWPYGEQVQCEKCGGKGVESSKRLTYRHRLGRAIHPNNSGGMQWGINYKNFHLRAWVQARRVLPPGGFLILNIKDHVRKGEVMQVTKWHRETLAHLDFTEVEHIKVKTPGMGFGANQQTLKIDYEHIIVFRKDAQ